MSLNRKASMQEGIALIETLITIVVVALGMLGILAMLINGLKLTSSSSYRTTASLQAQAMAEKLRANPSIVFTPASTTTVTFTTPGGSTFTTDCIKTTGCTSDRFVPTHLKIWREQLATVLPNGKGTVCQDSADGAPTPATDTWNCTNTSGSAPIVVKVCWNESRVQASAPSLTNGWMCVSEGI